MDDLSQATRQQTHAMLIIHCTERYHKINSELDGELETFARLHVSRLQARDRHLERLPGVPYNTASQHLTEKLVRHYLTYWLLQWDQYTYYHNGMLPAWAFEGWLLQRWEDYNFYNAILYNLPNSVQADEEADKSMRTASARQDFYRDGWKTAQEVLQPVEKRVPRVCSRT